MHAFVPTVLVLALAACQREAPEAQAAHPPATAATIASAHGLSDAQLLERGDYLVRIAGCNDCHTPGYAETGGKVAKDAWLVGSPMGWTGPWGTTYAANLRLKVAEMDDTAWLDYSAKLHTRPPMPDFAIRDMTQDDRLAIYRFVKSLGPGGQAAPAYLPPGQLPPMPYVEFKLPPPPATVSTAKKPASAG